jgi:hypothetical protein
MGAIMPIRGRDSKRGRLHSNLPQKLRERGRKLTHRTIQTPEIGGFSSEIINKNALLKSVILGYSILAVNH